MNDLPNELLYHIFSFLPANSLFSILFVCKKFKRIADEVNVPIRVFLAVDSYQEFLKIGLHRKTEMISVSPFDFWLEICLSTRNPLILVGSNDYTSFYQQTLHSYCASQMAGRSFILLLDTFDDRQRSESSYKIPWIDTKLYQNIRDLTSGFHVARIRHPIRNCVDFLPIGLRKLYLERVHNSVDLKNLMGLEYLHLSSDGRFLTQEGLFNYSCFGGLEHHQTLRHLVFDGPWLESMISYSQGAIDIFKTIHGLETLIIDLDMAKYGAESLYSLITSLPNLKRFGRIGGIDRRFWRLFPKFGNKSMSIIEVGSIKFPHTLLRDLAPSFLKDLALGLLWAFPNLKVIRIYMGFQGGNNCIDTLLEIVKQMKEGIPIVFKEYEQSILPDPSNRVLERVELFQVSDIQLFQASQWKYVAKRHGGGSPISISASDDLLISKARVF